MEDRGSLDEILCDPDLAKQFDEIARRLAPSRFTSLHYRWGALTLRKKSKTARVRSERFTGLSLDEYGKKQPLKSLTNEENFCNSPGLYLITGSRRETKYVGSALNLSKRMSTQFGPDQLDHWLNNFGATSIRHLPKPDVTDPIDLLSMQKRLIQLAKPILNDWGPTAA